MGNYVVSKCQIGTEATKGTPVAASTIWRGPAPQIDDARNVYFPDENIGNLPGKDRSITTQVDAVADFPEADATFEQLGYILGSAIEAEAGVQDGTGSGYVYTFDPPVDSKPALSYINSRTIETGDSEQAEEMEYSIVDTITIKGAMGQPVKVSSRWFGRQAQQTTFTAALSLPSVEEILASKFKLYIDNAGGTIGTTQITGELLEFELSITSGWKPSYHGDGQLYFTLAKFTKPLMSLRLMFDHETNSIAEKELWRSETARLIRLIGEGSALTTSDTYSNKTAIFDFAGKWGRFEPIAQRDDGISTVAATFNVRDNDTADFYSQFVLVNELTALP